MAVATSYYAATRAVEPRTRALGFTGATWTRGSPMREVVLRVLATPRGSYLPDPSFGVDYSVIQKAGPGVAAAWRAAVLAGLKRYTDRGDITDVQVTVEVANGVVRYAVAFRDPRSDDTTNPQRVTGTA